MNISWLFCGEINMKNIYIIILQEHYDNNVSK